MAAITLDIGGNTRQLDRDIQKTVNKVYSINLRTKGDQPLGRITGKVNEFTKSLDASNARVIAFGASAGIIYGLERAFTALVSSTIEVQKSLQDINVILNASQKQLQSFGSELFNIARNTGQSFQEVAKAATEFSRQGLGVEETLKRTSDALILSRLSGLDAAKSVEALTAAVNSFASQAVTASEIVNKFANVDAAFAVSSADLAEAISRVGSSAAQSGVSLNELIAIVTSAQQTTARGGAVIGNSFKTIFTRLQREKVVDLLESLGISSTDSSGQVKSTIQLLQDLGRVYDTLGTQQQSYVAEQVGGVFQINILKAALADLGKEYSIYSSALNVAASSTDQAIQRNEELNKTYAAQINALQENARQLAAAGGERLLGPTIERLVGGTNKLLEGFGGTDTAGIGANLGKGILDGLGQFIAGPGLVLIGGVLLKLFKDLGKFAAGSFQQLLGLNTASTQQRDLQASISQILQKNPQLIELALKGEQGLNTAANQLLASLQKQTVELQRQEQLAAQLAKAFMSAGVRMQGGVPAVPTKKVGKASGFIPNFVSDKVVEKAQAIALGATSSVRAHMSEGTIGGRKFVMNNQETEFPGVGRNGDSMVIPHYAAKGFIPNFAGVSSLKPTGSKLQDYKTILREGANYKGQFQKPFGSLTKEEANQALARARANKGQISTKQRSGTIDLGKTNKISLIYGQKAGVSPATGFFTDSNKNRYSATFQSSGFNAKVEPDESDLEDLLGKQVIDFVNRFSSIFGGNSSAAKIGNINQLANAGAFRSIAGTIFETAVTQATGAAVSQASRSGGQSAPIDYVSPNPKLRKLFNNVPGSYEAKIGNNPELVNSVADKAYRSGFFKKQGVFPGSGKVQKASGFVPNFASTNRGVPVSQIRAHFDQNGNPIAVTNKRDEPNGLKDAIGRERKGIGMYSRGFIPNFADPDTESASLTTVIGTLTTQLTGLAFAFSFSKDELKSSFNEIIQKNKEAGKVTGQWTAAQRQATKDLIKAGKITQEQALQRVDAARYKPTAMQKIGAFGQTNALGLSIAAPILGETVKNLVGQDTKGKRQTGTVASALGQIGGFAATGALVAGPGPQAAAGAAIGAAVGALTTVPGVVEAFVSDVPELQRAANKATENLTKFSDAGAKYFTALEKLSSAIDSGGGSNQKLVDQARKEYIDALSQLSTADQQALVQAERLGNAQEKYAELLEKKRQEEAGAKGALSVESAATESITNQSLTRFLGGVPRLVAKAGDAFSGTIRDTLGMEKNDFFKNAIAAYTPDTAFNPDSANAKVLEKAFLDISLAGATGQKQIDRLNQILQTFGQTGQIENIDQLKKVLSQTLGEDTEGSRRLIEAIEKSATTGLTDDASRKKAVQEIASIIMGGAIRQRSQTQGALESEAAGRADREKRIATLKQEQAAINATIASVQKNIAVQNLLARTLDSTAESFRSLSADINIARNFTQPADVLESLVGTTAKPAMGLRAKSDVALIEEQKRAGVATAGIDLKNNIRGALQKPFEENLGNIVKKLTEQGGALEGQPKDIVTQSRQYQSEARNQAENLNKVMQNMEGLMGRFISGQASSDQLLQAVRTELAGVGINVDRGTEASNEIEMAVAEFGSKSIAEYVKAFQQRAKLANETKQAILQSRIEQALGVFGGFEGFMNRPEDKETYIDKIKPDLENIAEIRSSPEFRYSNKESLTARKEKAPELGRSFAKVYQQLIDQSGGAFREFIQAGLKERQLTGGMGGAVGKLGGYDDIIAGRQEDLKQQLKLAEDELKVTTDPVLKRDLQGFISSIKNMPGGTKGIATLQTQKELGVARQSDFAQLYGKYENEALNRLKEISPELAASLSDAVTFGDPLLAEAQVQSGVQTQILQTIQKAISGQASETSGMVTPFDIEAYTKETDPAKRAAMKAGYGGITPVDMGSTAGEAVKNQIKAIQNKILPTTPKPAVTEPQKSVAQIEAETIAKRNAAAGMGMSLQDYNAAFPNKSATPIGPEPSKDYAKYQELNKPGQSFKSQDDMLLNFLQRLNFKETGKILPPEQLGFNKEPQKLQTQTTSFNQQEAALNNNTSSINTLVSAVDNFSTSISNLTENLNNQPNQPAGPQAQPGTQPNVTTTTNAPVNVVVNAQGANDIATAVGEAVQNAIPTIIDKVKVALGQKVPPKSP